MGNPFDIDTNIGALVSKSHMEKVQSYIEIAKQENGTILYGGKPANVAGSEKGYYLQPTVIEIQDNQCRVNQEEIFGPVLSIIAYEDEDDAVKIANDTVYGLSGGVWASTKEKGIAIARRIRTGQIAVNGGAFNINAPLGGYKQSGVGREYSEYGFDEFLEIKSMQL